MTEKISFYDPENDLIVIEDTVDAGEWLICMLSVALEVNAGNEAVRRLITDESKEARISGVDEELS